VTGLLLRGGSAAAALLLAVTAGLLDTTAASAATTTEVIQGDVLRLVSSADWDAASTLSPGEPVVWDVSVSANAPDPAAVRIGLRAAGGAPLVVDIMLCTQDWDPDGCAGEAMTIETAWSVPRDGILVPLTTASTADETHLRLSVAVAAAGSASTQLTVQADTTQETVAVTPGGDGLATTGLPQSGPWILGTLAAVLVGLGAVLLARTRRSEDAP
jgi:hypothetical protein